MEGETICIGHLPVTWDFCELTTVCSYDRESYLGLVFLLSFFFFFVLKNMKVYAVEMSFP